MTSDPWSGFLVPQNLKRIVDRAAGKEHSASGPVMACLAEVLAAHEAMVLRRAADRILLVSELGMGYRCPACHGKPAVIRWRDTGRKKRYVCGCGHQWDPLSHSAGWRAGQEWSTSVLLGRVAETGALPEVPDKIEGDRRE